MRRYLAQLREVRATGFPSPEQADSARFAPPERKLTLYGQSGQVLAELSLDSLASTFVLRKGAGTDRYTLDQKMTELVVPAESTFRR